MYQFHDMSGWGASMMVLWTVIWLGALGLLAWAIVQWTRRTPDGGTSKSARELLDERLATGEIDIDEYRRRRAAMDGQAPAPG